MWKYPKKTHMHKYTLRGRERILQRTSLYSSYWFHSVSKVKIIFPHSSMPRPFFLNLAILLCDLSMTPLFTFPSYFIWFSVHHSLFTYTCAACVISDQCVIDSPLLNCQWFYYLNINELYHGIVHMLPTVQPLIWTQEQPATLFP